MKSQQLLLCNDLCPNSFELLKELPIEIVRDRILYQYCDGKSLSTLAMTLLMSTKRKQSSSGHYSNSRSTSTGSNTNQHHPYSIPQRHYAKLLKTSLTINCHYYTTLASEVVPSIAQRRLLSIAKMIEEHVSKSGVASQAANAIKWIRSVAKMENTSVNSRSIGTEICSTLVGDDDVDLGSGNFRNMRIVSEMLAVVDFVEMSSRDYSNVILGQFEWPIWYGNITIDFGTIDATKLVRSTTRVVLTAPMTELPNKAGSGMISRMHDYHTIPSHPIFHCEQCNQLPTAPWGKVRGLTDVDDRMLQPLKSHLLRTNEIAMPNRFNHQRNSNHHGLAWDVHILTQKQARQRLHQHEQTQNRDYSVRSNRFYRSNNVPLLSSTTSDWILDSDRNNKNYLICCWQSSPVDDSSILPEDINTTIEYIIDLLKAKERLLLQQN